jgi:hypothetical protein
LNIKLNKNKKWTNIYITALRDYHKVRKKSIQFPEVVADLISRVKDGEPMDWRYDLGEDVYVLIKAPQLTIHEVSLGVIMTNTEIKFHILLFTLH